MKKIIVIFFTVVSSPAWAQLPADSATIGKITVEKDPRLELLAKKEAEFNAATVGMGNKAAKGYRLLVLSSNDRNYAMKVRAQLLQNFPDQKVYMTFQAPFIKLKFGNFIDKDDAERYKKMLATSKIVTTNVYVVPEIIEVKADKTKETGEE